MKHQPTTQLKCTGPNWCGTHFRNNHGVHEHTTARYLLGYFYNRTDFFILSGKEMASKAKRVKKLQTFKEEEYDKK